MRGTFRKTLLPALTAAAALACLGGVARAQNPGYARIAVGGQNVVYIQAQGGCLYAAMSVEGLRSATPARMTLPRPHEGANFDYALPVPADQLPSGITAIKAVLVLASIQVRAKTGAVTPLPVIAGQIAVCRTDSRNVEWQYVSQVNVRAGASAENAPIIKLPDPDRLSAVLKTKTSSGQLAVGLRVTAGDAVLCDVRKNGQSVQAAMVVTNVWGGVETSRTGPISDFGFS